MNNDDARRGLLSPCQRAAFAAALCCAFFAQAIAGAAAISAVPFEIRLTISWFGLASASSTVVLQNTDAAALLSSPSLPVGNRYGDVLRVARRRTALPGLHSVAWEDLARTEVSPGSYSYALRHGRRLRTRTVPLVPWTSAATVAEPAFFASLAKPLFEVSLAALSTTGDLPR